MIAGPELDHEVATKVMGAKPCQLPCEGCESEWTQDSSKGWVYRRGACWSPSTYCQDAWEVVDKLGLLTFPRSLQQSSVDGKWIIEEYCGEVCSILATEATVPLAICAAALKLTPPTVGEEGK